MTSILGIDPGLDGAFVLLSETGKIRGHTKMPLIKVSGQKERIDESGLVELVQYFSSYPNLHVWMEHLQNTPGRTGVFSFGDGYGLVRGMFLYTKTPVSYVLPKVWKKAMMPGMPADKVASCVAAARVFPESKSIMLKPRGTLDDGIADALLIAAYGRQQLLNGTS